MRYYLILLLVMVASWGVAQENTPMLTGVIVDKDTGDSISSVGISYKSKKITVGTEEDGTFIIPRHNGFSLTITALGYKSQKITVNASTPDHLIIELKSESTSLGEVVVKRKRKSKYSRKDNPAVELMKRVIDAKKRTDLENYDYYQYYNYQKITLAVNDVTAEDILEAEDKKMGWIVNQIEPCPFNNKLILPLSVDETVTQHLYRKAPKKTKEIIKGQNTRGVNQLIETGNILNSMLKDVFTDVDIYDDQIRLLQFPFTSPIGKDAIRFYRYYIEDTVYVENDYCYHLQFLPNNQQDFGFRGELFILADSSLHVRKCNLTIPQRSDVNFVENMRIEQEYKQLDNGEWVLVTDNMMVEMSLTKFLSKAVVLRTTHLYDYSFDPIPNKMFKGKATKFTEANAKMRDDTYWSEVRQTELTKSESSMDDFIHNMQQVKGFKYILWFAKAVIENFVETGTQKSKSKFDIGPVNTVISSNYVDGIRYRLSGQTTAALNPHLFFKGYYAYGRDTKKHYYNSQITYSFNKKEYQPTEFPIKSISFTSTYDVMSPSDKFLYTDKDNVFTSFRWKKVNQMYFYQRQDLKFDWETDWGFRTNIDFKCESNEPTGEMAFNRIADGEPVNKIRTTEMSLGFTYCPGRTYINTKQHRLPVNFDAPEFSINHTMGFKGLLGGQYRYNYTEAGIYKRIWLNSWGRMNIRLKLGAQWNKVPFPLLIMPPANLSYVIEEGTFSLMNNMEFLNDRYAYADISWELNGKIFNRIPLIKKLKWRESFGFKGMMGRLTDKNNPFLPQNANDNMLFQFPTDTHLMRSNEPYWEFHAGIHNIFKFFEIDYVRRLNYTGYKGVKKDGIRFTFEFTF